MSVTAIVIARAGSRRLPNKNMMSFHGLPLVAHKVRQLKRCQYVDTVIVGSDSEEILAAAKKQGADTRVRAREFCDEVSRTWNEVIVDMALRVPGETILWAHCTNPCILPSTYDRAIAYYQQALKEDSADSLLSVSAVSGHAWYMEKPVNYDPYADTHVVAARLDPIYFQNGGIFIYGRAEMIRDRYVFGKRPKFIALEPDEAIDVDTQADFDRASVAYGWTLL